MIGRVECPRTWLTLHVRCSILEHLTAALANQGRMALRYADLFGVNAVGIEPGSDQDTKVQVTSPTGIKVQGPAHDGYAAFLMPPPGTGGSDCRYIRRLSRGPAAANWVTSISPRLSPGGCTYGGRVGTREEGGGGQRLLLIPPVAADLGS